MQFKICLAEAALDYLHAPALTILYAAALISCRRTSQCSSSLARNVRKRQLSILLMLLIVVSYASQGVISLSRALRERGWWAPQHSIVHIIGSVLQWGSLSLLLLSADRPNWHAYLVTWSFGCLFEIILCVLTALSTSGNDEYRTITLIIQAFRITCTSILSGNSVMLLYHSGAEELSDEERQPLLLDESHTGASAADEIIAKQRKRLEEQGLIGYLKAFTIFVPYIWPRDNLKAKLCIAFLIFDLVVRRFLNVFIPRQLGIITDKLAVTILPWSDVLVWIVLKWLDSLAGLEWIKQFALEEVRNHAYKGIYDLAFGHVMRLSMDFHSNKDTGELVKSVEQASSMTRLLESAILDMFPIGVDVIVAIWYVTHLFDLYMAVATITIGIAYVWTGLVFNAWIQPRFRVFAEKSRAQSSIVYESISNWQTVSHFDRTGYERERYGAAIQASIKATLSYLFWWYLGSGVQSLILTVGLLGCSFLALWEISWAKKPVGNFVTFTLYWGTMMFSLQRIAWSFRDLTSSLVGAERLLQLLNTKPTIAEQRGCPALTVDAGNVAFRDVSFAYSSQTEVIKRINFEALPGETVAIVGESGGGKSTLLNLMCRFFDPSKGSITIDGQDLRSVTLSSLYKQIGVVPQDPALFNLSILENLLYANEKATREEVEQACKAAAIHDAILSLPLGYHSKVGERGVKLSGGQRQRLAIARVLLQDPRIVLLDEATSAVDSATEAKIQDAFKVLGTGRTMFIIAHRLSTVMHANQILVMAKGEIVERGTHQELLAKGGKYAELWNIQTKSK